MGNNLNNGFEFKLTVDNEPKVRQRIANAFFSGNLTKWEFGMVAGVMDQIETLAKLYRTNEKVLVKELEKLFLAKFAKFVTGPISVKDTMMYLAMNVVDDLGWHRAYREDSRKKREQAQRKQSHRAKLEK